MHKRRRAVEFKVPSGGTDLLLFFWPCGTGSGSLINLAEPGTEPDADPCPA
jgi:hypothetical protein